MPTPEKAYRASKSERLHAWNQKRLLEAYGKDPAVVPDWPNDEYDRIYVFRIKDVGGRKDLTFSVEQQGLTDSLSEKCPAQ